MNRFWLYTSISIIIINLNYCAIFNISYIPENLPPIPWYTQGKAQILLESLSGPIEKNITPKFQCSVKLFQILAFQTFYIK